MSGDAVLIWVIMALMFAAPMTVAWCYWGAKRDPLDEYYGDVGRDDP